MNGLQLFDNNGIKYFDSTTINYSIINYYFVPSGSTLSSSVEIPFNLTNFKAIPIFQTDIPDNQIALFNSIYLNVAGNTLSVSTGPSIMDRYILVLGR